MSQSVGRQGKERASGLGLRFFVLKNLWRRILEMSDYK